MEVLQLETPALSMLGKDVDGEMMGITIISVQITNMVDYLDLKWTPYQIGECSRLTYEEYYWLSVAELKQFFNRVKTGFYQSEKNIRPDVFAGFLLSYTNEMHAARGSYFSGKEKRSWTPPETPVTDDVFSSKMNEIMSILAPKDESIADKLGGEDQFEKLKDQAAQQAKSLGVSDEFINEVKNK
jgi:hypothetical protein